MTWNKKEFLFWMTGCLRIKVDEKTWMSQEYLGAQFVEYDDLASAGIENADVRMVMWNLRFLKNGMKKHEECLSNFKSTGQKYCYVDNKPKGAEFIYHETFIQRILLILEKFTSISTISSYPLSMIKRIANPFHLN